MGVLYTVNWNWNDFAVVRSLKIGNFHGGIGLPESEKWRTSENPTEAAAVVALAQEKLLRTKRRHPSVQHNNNRRRSSSSSSSGWWWYQRWSLTHAPTGSSLIGLKLPLWHYIQWSMSCTESPFQSVNENTTWQGISIRSSLRNDGLLLETPRRRRAL